MITQKELQQLARTYKAARKKSKEADDLKKVLKARFDDGEEIEEGAYICTTVEESGGRPYRELLLKVLGTEKFEALIAETPGKSYTRLRVMKDGEKIA